MLLKQRIIIILNIEVVEPTKYVQIYTKNIHKHIYNVIYTKSKDSGVCGQYSIDFSIPIKLILYLCYAKYVFFFITTFE